ncbi:MAG: RHS repeat-associated core domain-containing protein [Francisellaceae bacterium]
MKFKKSIAMLSSITYLTVFFIDPVYAAVKTESRDDSISEQSDNREKNNKAGLSTTALNSMLALASSGSGDSFQSQASNSALLASISVNPEKLQVEFLENIATLKSSGNGSFLFDLKLDNMHPSQAFAEVIDGVSLSLNIPYIKYMFTKNNTQYYELLAGDNKFFFSVSKDDNGNRKISFSYQKKDNVKLTFEDDDHIKFINQDGAVLLFEHAKGEGLSYLYPVSEMVNNQGKKFSFDYRTEGSNTDITSGDDLAHKYQDYQGITIKDDQGETVATTGKLSSNLYLITYKDAIGREQTFRITHSGSDIKLTNPINETITLTLDNNLITQANFPNGVSYKADYEKINDVGYIIDGQTQQVKQNSSYVKSFTKYLNNKYSEDQSYHYSLSTDGHNYLGNGISCSEATMVSLDPLQDWMMECNLQDNSKYSYSTHVSNTIPIFSGNSETSNHTLEMSQNYYGLHLPHSTQVLLDNREVSFQEYAYDQSTLLAHSFASLSDAYANPVKKTNSFFDLYDPGSPAHKYVEDYVYYTNSNDPGYAKGELKSSIDGMGNETRLAYYPKDPAKNNYQSIIESKTTYLKGYDQPIIVKSDGLNWLDTTVNANDQDIVISKPYIERVLNYLNSTVTKSEEIKLATDKSSLLYGLPESAITHIDGDKPYTAQKTSAYYDENHYYVVSNSQQSLADEANIAAPTSINGEMEYYNQYGALVRVVDPLSGDVTIYGDENGNNGYDALGRVIEITYMPAGNRDLKQTYTFDYALNKDPGDVGYVLTTTTLLPGMTKGYQTKTYYDNEQHVTRTEKQTKDHSDFYVTQENFYNHLGQTDHTVSWYYDEAGEKHPLQTNFFYDATQQVTAVQHPDGSTDVSVNDDYNNLVFNYTLLPTETPLTAGDQSLCFNPLLSEGDTKQYTTCKVTGVSVSSREFSDIGSPSRPIWKLGNSYDYSIIMDPEFSYSSNDASSMKDETLYDETTQTDIAALNTSLAKGHAYDINALRTLADKIKEKCLNGQCQAASFNQTSYDVFGQPVESKDYIQGLAAKNIYSDDDPSRLIAQTLSSLSNHQAFRTTYYEYDDFGNVAKTYISKGDYDADANKTLVGAQKYSALGYLLKTTSLIGAGNAGKTVNFEYDKTTGLPTKMVDAVGNVVTMQYKDPNWKLRPSRVDYTAANTSNNTAKNQSFYVTYSYTSAGNLAMVEKRGLSGNLISKTEYGYDPDTLELINTSITYANGETHSLLNHQNQYFATTSNEYLANNSPKLNVSSQTNHLGLPMVTTYSGVANFSLTQDYNPDLSLHLTKHGTNKATGFSYDSVGRLSDVENYVNEAVVRKYSYLYNRLGQKAKRIANTEATKASGSPSEQRYDYTMLGQLKTLYCTGAECPVDENGHPIAIDTYSYDELFNKLTQVSHQLQDGASSQVDYAYANVDPTQATAITYSHTEDGKTTTERDINLLYDNNGNVIHMETNYPQQSKTEYQDFIYDAEQNLVQLRKGSMVVDYDYDSSGSQIAEHFTDANGNLQSLYQYYIGGLSEQKIDNESRYYLDDGSIHNGEYQANITDGFNATGSLQGGEINGNYVYTPFGGKQDIQKNKELQQAQQLALSIQKTNLGYRTMNTDSITGWQFLGNGYRAYNPDLRLFMKHDSASPLGIGGFNAYSYSLNDPVNMFDPSGHAANGDLSNLSDVMKKQYEYKQNSEKARAVAFLVIIASLVISIGLGYFIGPAMLATNFLMRFSVRTIQVAYFALNFAAESAIELTANRIIYGRDFVRNNTGEYLAISLGVGAVAAFMSLTGFRLGLTERTAAISRNTVRRFTAFQASRGQTAASRGIDLVEESGSQAASARQSFANLERRSGNEIAQEERVAVTGRSQSMVAAQPSRRGGLDLIREMLGQSRTPVRQTARQSQALDAPANTRAARRGTLSEREIHEDKFKMQLAKDSRKLNYRRKLKMKKYTEEMRPYRVTENSFEGNSRGTVALPVRASAANTEGAQIIEELKKLQY